MKKPVLYLWIAFTALAGARAGADIPNISFGGDLTKMSQREVTNQMRQNLTALSNQSAALKSEYQAVASQARGKINGGGSGAARELAFANALINIGTNLSAVYRRGTTIADDRTSEIDPAMDELLEKIISMFDDPSAGELYKAKIKIFQMAKYIEQRKVWLLISEKTTKEDELKQFIEDTNETYSTSIPSGAIYYIFRTIPYQLSSDIPRQCGPNAKQLITIFEDDSQFRAWTDDAQLLGFTIDLPQR